jgi:uncharacterized protein YqeY
MSLKQQLTDDMKTAMKSGEKDRLGVIRLINAAIKQKEVDERIELDDRRWCWPCWRRWSSSARTRSASTKPPHARTWPRSSATSSGIIDAYLPAKLGEAAILAEIDKAIAATGAASARPTSAS